MKVNKGATLLTQFREKRKISNKFIRFLKKILAT